MNGPTINQSLPVIGSAIIGGVAGANSQSTMEVNSYRIGVVAEKLAALSTGQKNEYRDFFHLCLSLARGIDYAVANNEVPPQASNLAPVLKQVCQRKNEFLLQAAIMVLMISVKNACNMGWFADEDTEELLALANEVGSYFCTMGNINSDVTGFLPTVSNIMSRFYPRLKLGHVIASLEIKPGYGTYVVDFHIAKNISYSQEEKIRLFVAMKDNIDTSSCIISPQQVNILLNGRGVERRINVCMDQGPQLPTIVNPLLKYGTNLLQAVGQFNGHYIILIAFMSVVPPSSLPAPQDYVQPEATALSSGLDSDIVEGPSRISLNCPISYRRITTPVKGHLCKHYQCFDFSNYVEINSKRPSWRCPHCNQSVCCTDIRVDQKIIKVLQEVGENVSEVIISADGSWTAASSSHNKEDLHEKTSANQEKHELQESSPNGHLSEGCNVYDLTVEDDEMDTLDQSDPVDTKPVVHHNVQVESIPTNLAQPPIPQNTNQLNQYSSSQVVNGLSSGALLYDSGPASYNIRPEAQNVGGVSGAPTGNIGISPVLTDAVSPALNRQPDNFQGPDYRTSSISVGQLSASNNLQFQEMLFQPSIMSNDLGRTRMIPRNVSRTSSAIQALPVQMPPSTPQQQLRPIMSIPAGSGSSLPFTLPPLPSNAQLVSPTGSNVERQRHPQQPRVSVLNVSNIASNSMLNRSPSQVVAHPSHNTNFRMPQTLSQPPHLMRSSQVPRVNAQQGVPHVVASNSPSTVQRVQLMAQQPAQMRHPQTAPLQTQMVRMTSSLPLNTGAPPQAVSRTENLIDLESEQNWRPTGRMRGSLTGPAYSAALSQLMMGQATQQAQVPSHRTPVTVSSSIPAHLQALLANRMNAQVSQVQNRSTMDAANVTGTAGSHPHGP